jgi:hypothetical protein
VDITHPPSPKEEKIEGERDGIYDEKMNDTKGLEMKNDTAYIGDQHTQTSTKNE